MDQGYLFIFFMRTSRSSQTAIKKREMLECYFLHKIYKLKLFQWPKTIYVYFIKAYISSNLRTHEYSISSLLDAGKTYDFSSKNILQRHVLAARRRQEAEDSLVCDKVLLIHSNDEWMDRVIWSLTEICLWLSQCLSTVSLTFLKERKAFQFQFWTCKIKHVGTNYFL